LTLTKKQLRVMIKNDKKDILYFSKLARMAKFSEERVLQRRLASYARRSLSDARALLKLKTKRK
jgi:hypothetical protein